MFCTKYSEKHQSTSGLRRQGVPLYQYTSDRPSQVDQALIILLYHVTMHLCRRRRYWECQHPQPGHALSLSPWKFPQQDSLLQQHGCSSWPGAPTRPQPRAIQQHTALGAWPGLFKLPHSPAKCTAGGSHNICLSSSTACSHLPQLMI